MDRREVDSAEAARQRSARLIVVGTCGKESFGGAIPGSAAHKLPHISERLALGRAS